MPHRRTCVTRCAADNGTSRPALAFFATGGQGPALKPSELLAAAPAASEPIPVYTGPTKTGPALIAAVAVDSERQPPVHHGKKSRVAAKKPDAPPATQADAGAKPVSKRAVVRHATAEPDAAPNAAEKRGA